MQVSELTLEEKIGQLLCAGWHACCEIDAQAIACLTELHCGGLIVMGRNLHDTKIRPLPVINALAVRKMTDALQARSRIPLFIATDQEGGRVARFGTAPFTRQPAAALLLDPYEAARQTGRELQMVGVNFNFAPVADINSNPKNPVIGDRAFGVTVESVVPKVIAQLRGYQDAGILSCLKHFPGHGDTAIDSHLALPTLPHTLSEMQARELVPFVAGIGADAPAIMTAHILFPALDAALPATMSQAILTELLRDQLGFDGLIVTDCLEMKAVADHWGTARAALEAVKAGADIVLVCHTLERQREVFELLLAAARSGELPESRIDSAARRILRAKNTLAPTPEFDPSVFGGTELLSEATTLGASAPQY
jgi:beta-N-acetylhexosaminidase